MRFIPILTLLSAFSIPTLAGTFPISHLYEKVSKMTSLVEQVTPTNCKQNLNIIFEELSYIQPSQYKLGELLPEIPKMLEGSLQLRQTIRHKMIQFYQDNTLTAECALAVKHSVRSLRGFEDYIGHLSTVYKKNMILSPAFSNQFDLKSGDLLISRGDAFTSATIARLADEQLQYSHLALIYVDPQTKKVFALEAHMEKGSVATPFKEYFKDGKVRSTLYRHSDSVLAAKAAEIMYQRITTDSETTGNIPYDMQMNLDDHDALFCTEVIRQGYKEASQGTVMVPMFMSTFSMQNRTLFDRLGTDVTETFLPADIEADPRFEMINDWRDFERINEAWTYDAIMTKTMEWMERDDYRLRNTPPVLAITDLAYVLRRTPLIKRLLTDRMSLDMDRGSISATVILLIVVNKLEKKIKTLEKSALKHSGYPMTITQQIAALETLKALKPNISRSFRP